MHGDETKHSRHSMNLTRMLFGLVLASLLPGHTIHAQLGQSDRERLDDLLAQAGEGHAVAQTVLGSAFKNGHYGMVIDEKGSKRGQT